MQYYDAREKIKRGRCPDVKINLACDVNSVSGFVILVVRCVDFQPIDTSWIRHDVKKVPR